MRIDRLVLTPSALDARSYGVRADGSTDDTVALQAFVTAAQATVSVGVHGRVMELPPGEIVISDTISVTRFTGIVRGFGKEISPAYTADPGKSTVIRWNGSAGSPMFRVRDSRSVTFENLRLEGKDSAKPSYGIEFNNNGGSAGTNEYMTVRDVYIGRYTWSSQGTNKGDVDSGIGFTGTNANNDQFLIDNVQVYNPASYGLYVPNSQSVGGVAHKLVVYAAGLAGVYTGASIRLDNPEFYFCASDIQLVSGATRVIVDNIKSEEGAKLATLGDACGLVIRGGNVQVQDVITGDEVLIAASPTDGQLIVLEDVAFTGMTDATKCRWEFGPVSPTYVGNFRYVVTRCLGITPDQLVFASGASMWASSPESRGTIDWDSRTSNMRYQFRNELRTNGRATLDTTAWDYPRTSTSSSAETVTKVLTGPTGSKTMDWADLASGAEQTTTVTCTGAALGDLAEASMSVDLAGTKLTAYVSATDTVTVVHRNDTGGNVNLASGTLRVATRRIA